jgi:hypothetical protein
MKEEKNTRSIVRWHRDLPLQTCKKCQRPFAPTFQLNEFAKRVNLDRSRFDNCPDCR